MTVKVEYYAKFFVECFHFYLYLFKYLTSILYFCRNNSLMENKDFNRIKVVLVEHKRTARWLSEALGKDPATVSKWCTNTTQPSLETLFKISELLQVPVLELIKKQNI